MNKNVMKALITASLLIAAALFALRIMSHSAARKAGVTGFDRSDVTAANFRWALFEEWARGKERYKGWESNPELFKRANEEFRKNYNASVEVIK